MRTRLVGMLAVMLILLVAAVPAAHAVLERVGPNNNAPTVGGFPAWYQDTTGLAVEFCDPLNASELAGGWCLLAPGDPPAFPEVFPTAFFDEHFWWVGDAGMDTANGGRALLRLAVEAAFAAAVEPGGQITFSRIRVKLTNVPVRGTYRFIHPYGEELITCPDDCRGAAGDLIFFTDDVGINCPPGGPFDCALQSRLGPFLLPSATPGGAEMPPVSAANPTPDTDPAHFGGAFAPTPYPGTGKSYIADPARIGPVTGSPLPNFIDSTGASRNHNIFRIEGPAGSNLGGGGNDFIETTDFALMGRVFQGPIAGRVTVDRASYALSRDLVNNVLVTKVDVFATAFPSTQGRLPHGPPPAVVTPQLVYFDGPCFDPLTGNAALAGLTSNQMFFAGSKYWGQSTPAAIPASPAEVCVVQTNALAANNQFTSAFFSAPLGDQVSVTAFYDPATTTLSVTASSADVVGAPTLTVPGLGPIDATTGQGTFTFTVPPAKVTVLSSKGGSNEVQVTTGAGATGSGTAIPIALNDTATVIENSGTAPIPVLANDTLGGGAIPAGATVALVALPRLGTAAVAVNGTSINYTPGANANGTDIFSYTVAVNGVVSNEAAVTVTITNVNNPPVANNDSATAIVGVVTPISVLANDTDPDGQADIVAVATFTQPTPAGASVALQADNRTVNFTASVAGTYSFTYQARDAANALSNVATVTVAVAGTESITIARAEVRNGNRLRVDGTISPPAGQTLTIEYAFGSTVLGLAGTALADAAGVWGIDVRQAVVPAQASHVKVTSSNGSVVFAPLVRR